MKSTELQAGTSALTLKHWQRDLPASLVVFLVALPLCMGVAIASGAPVSRGLVTGIVGGLIVGQWSWRWIFLINLPVGVVAVVLARRLLPEAQPRLGARLDLRGLALLSPGIALLLYGIAEAGSQGGFENARTLGAAGLGLAFVVAFVWHAARKGKDALLDLTLFGNRGFATAAATNFALGLALFGALILLPLYYQLVRGESPLETGLLLAPQGLGAALAMPLTGDFAAKVVAKTQPVKLAAMEGQWETTARAPLRIGGWPDEKAETTRGAIEIPGALSWLAYGHADSTVRGLSDVPPADRPPVAIVHVAFQIMVGSGSLLALMNGFVIMLLSMLGEYVVRTLNAVSAVTTYHVARRVSSLAAATTGTSSSWVRSGVARRT